MKKFLIGFVVTAVLLCMVVVALVAGAVGIPAAQKAGFFPTFSFKAPASSDNTGKDLGSQPSGDSKPQASPQGETQAAASSTGSVQFPGFSISGVPAQVDKKNVLFANGPDAYGNNFTNTLGNGTAMMFAEPGSILCGPGDPNCSPAVNAHAEYFNPINQVMFVTPETDVSLGENGFVVTTAAGLTADVGDVRVTLNSDQNFIWFLAVRGLYPDASTPADRNRTIHFSDYVSGHAQAMRYPPGAYISEDQLVQMVETGHTNQYSDAGQSILVTSRNCGDAGCRGLGILMLDTNTGAYAVVWQDGQGGPWQFVESNWYTP